MAAAATEVATASSFPVGSSSPPPPLEVVVVVLLPWPLVLWWLFRPPPPLCLLESQWDAFAKVLCCDPETYCCSLYLGYADEVVVVRDDEEDQHDHHQTMNKNNYHGPASPGQVTADDNPEDYRVVVVFGTQEQQCCTACSNTAPRCKPSPMEELAREDGGTSTFLTLLLLQVLQVLQLVLELTSR